MTFSLIVPFKLAPGQRLSIVPVECAWGEQQLRIQRSGAGYELSVSGFPSVAEAGRRFHELRGAFDWASLQLSISVSSEKKLETVIIAPDPELAAMAFNVREPVHGACNNLPRVVEDGKNIHVIRIGELTVHVETASSDFVEHLMHAVANHVATSDDGRLRTALDLYQSHFFETSQEARFLTLVMCLEALAVPTPKPDRVQHVMNRWENELAELKDSSSGEERAAFDALSKELSFRRDSSVSSNIRAAVRGALTATNDPIAAAAAKEATSLYHQRSKLLHEGKLERANLIEAVGRAQILVRRVLEARLLAGK